MPVVTCDPRTGLASGQYFNPNCFTVPAAGTQGDLIWPYMKGPSYFSSDLSLMKNFKIGEGKSIQFRVHGTNFLNHPNPQFSLNGAQDINLQLKIPSTGAYAGTNQNPATTGFPEFTTGMRLIEFAAKFYF